MEVVTILIGIAVFIISALMIYCISAFSMREKTFEEVIEEQRRREEVEREKAKAEKKAEREQQKKKYKKGKHDNKVKEKAAQATEPEVKLEPKMVNLEIEPEIIEQTETLGLNTLNTAIRQRVKKEKISKPILQNKGEHTPVVEKAAELYHKSVVPKDELELKKSHEKIVVEKIEKVKVIHTEKQHEKEKVIHSEKQHEKEIKVKHSTESKENLPPKKADKDVEHVTKQHASETHITKQHTSEVEKRSPKLKAPVDDAPISGSRLISSVKSANLTDSEVQSLIEILLNRQGSAASESWNKKSQKGDPTAALKKQLEEKERALQDEQAMTIAANTRVKEMQAEKQKHVATEKRLLERVEQLNAELIALQNRMQHSHDQHINETSGLQNKIKLLEQGSDKTSTHKLTEENKILQDSLNLKVSENVRLNDKMKNFEKEINKLQKSIQTNEAATKTLELQISGYEDKIRKLEAEKKDVDSMTHKKVEEVNHELRKAEAKNTTLSSDLQKANGALNATQEEVKTLKAKLQELETHLTKAETGKEIETKLHESEQKRSDLEGNVKNLEKQLAGYSQRLSESETELHRLQQENRTLTEENKTVKERLQTASASNGDIHENGPGIPLAEHEQIISGKDKEMSDLTASLETQKKSLLNIQGQLDTKVAEVTALQEQLNQQKTKNDELRQKNWKAMEALEKAEKSATEKVDKALKSARELNTAGITEIEVLDKTVFQRLFPDVKVSDKLVHKEWVVAFEKQALKKVSDTESSIKTSALVQENDKLKKDLAELTSNLNSLNTKELEEQNKRLQKQLDEYEKQSVEWKSQSEKLKHIEAEYSQLKSSVTTSGNDTEKYIQLKQDNDRLKSELENYQGIVTDTENKMHQLEKSIDDEAKVWREKLKQAESQAKEDTSLLNQRIKELESLIAQQDGQVQEYRRVLSLSMETRVLELEDELRAAHEMIIVITKEKETVITQLSESQKHTTGVDTERFDKELQTLLDNERKKTRELSLNIVKLNGIIKTGQDALSQEQNLVKKLQESLDSKSVNSGGTELEEIDQLRIKLSEKQKLLDREITTNKQLSERLAQLGVLAASTSDSGTSV